jgi:nitric oxide reductase NorD protein
VFDGEVLALPEAIDCFADRELNASLYRWLAAWLANVRADAVGLRVADDHDPLRADLRSLAMAQDTTRRVLAAWPGLAGTWDALTKATLQMRPDRKLGMVEGAVEQVVRALLGGTRTGDTLAARFFDAVTDFPPVLDDIAAPRGYRPYLPVPLWGDIVDRGQSPPRNSPDTAPARAARDAGERRRKAGFRHSEQADRKDPLIFNRFEYLLSIAQMLNLSRSVDDDDPDCARQAADTVDEITVSDHSRKAASRLRLDLDLASAAATPASLGSGILYPEWDYRTSTYRMKYCRVLDTPAASHGDGWQPDAASRRRIRQIRRQFEALRPRRRLLSGQCDGDDLDLSAVIRSRADRASGHTGTDRVYRQARNVERDLSVALLIDASLSTDSFVHNRRVLDVEKESALALMHGLDALGDEHAVYAFSSRNREAVSITTLKEFDEELSDRVRRRLSSLQPGHYTRIGAALRHVTAMLVARKSRHRLLLLVTDGKPNDMDLYEGRYGVEDTRRAVQEARRAGLGVFGITIDRKAREYLPYLFGPGGFAIVRRVEKLPDALPAIYRRITTASSR